MSLSNPTRGIPGEETESVGRGNPQTSDSVRLLVEQLRNSLLYQWFAGLELGEEVCRRAVFGKDTRRLLNEQVAGEFFRRERPALL
jgi:hypothetical protein